MNGRDTRARRAPQPAARTYVCLEEQRKKPSDYEVTTTALLYYPARGFEVKTPVWDHYVEHQQRGMLGSQRWDSFRDPAHTTYTSYVAERRDQETFLDRLFERAPSALPNELEPLLGYVSAIRFPLHGLQMVAAYVGALAPSGRISVPAAFQAADELRRIQRLCQWLSRAGRPLAELDALGRELWQQSPELQPLRRSIEQLLVTYDWGAALVIMNGLIKPLFDRLWFSCLADLAREHREEVLEKTLHSLADDGRWHAAWFVELARLLTEESSENAQAISALLSEQYVGCVEAARAFTVGLGATLGDSKAQERVTRDLESSLGKHLAQLGLDPKPESGKGRHVDIA